MEGGVLTARSAGRPSEGPEAPERVAMRLRFARQSSFPRVHATGHVHTELITSGGGTFRVGTAVSSRRRHDCSSGAIG